MSPSIDNDDFFGDHVHDWDEIYQLVCKSEQSTNPPSLLLTCFSYIFLATGQVKLIRRNRQGQDIYRTWIKETLSKYESLEEYMLKEKLKFPETVDKERPPVIVLPNDFPYSTEPGIEHHLIWLVAGALVRILCQGDSRRAIWQPKVGMGLLCQSARDSKYQAAAPCSRLYAPTG